MCMKPFPNLVSKSQHLTRTHLLWRHHVYARALHLRTIATRSLPWGQRSRCSSLEPGLPGQQLRMVGLRAPTSTGCCFRPAITKGRLFPVTRAETGSQIHSKLDPHSVTFKLKKHMLQQPVTRRGNRIADPRTSSTPHLHWFLKYKSKQRAAAAHAHDLQIPERF